MSSMQEEAFVNELKESGVGDFVRDHIRESIGTPEEPQDTGSTPESEARQRDPETGRFVASQSEGPEAEPVEETEDEVEEPQAEVKEEEVVEEDDVGYELDLDEELEAFLQKHDGDLEKTLRKAMWLESVTGRQGNELGELKQQLQDLSEQLQASPQQFAPYMTRIPDEDEAEPEEMAAAYSSLAYEALERKDASTMGQAVEAWKDVDPFGAAVFVTSLQNQVVLQQLGQTQETSGPTLEAEMAKITEKYPDIREYADKIGELAQQRPTLRTLMENGTSAEKAQAFEDLYLVIKSRETSEHSTKALKRVAVRQSEEARKARAEARVVQGERAATEPVKQEPDDELIRFGNTGSFVSMNRINEEIARSNPDAPMKIMRGGRLVDA